MEQSQIKVDGLNVSIGNFTFAIPSATAEALKFAGAIGTVATTALQAAVAVANFQQVSTGISADAQKIIDRNSKQLQIQQLEKAGKFSEAAKLKAELQIDGDKFQGADYDALMKSYTEGFLYQYNNKPKGGGGGTKPKKTKADKAKEKAHKNLDSWNSYFDELKRANADAVQSIALNEQRSIAELEKHLKTGVVKQQEAEMARTHIAQRYAKERAELVGRYAEKAQIKFNLDKSLSELEGLKQLGLIGGGDAKEAEMRLRLKYSQDISQYAVSATDQVKGIYDPNQAELNRQTQELAQLQSFNEQKLMTEEAYQQRKQAIIERYKNEQWQKEMSSYTQGLNDLGGAFDALAGVVERSAGKQSTAYKAMFALSKGFAIAEASIKLSQAIAQALADPTALTPAQKFANMATVAAAGANLVSQISSVGFATGGNPLQRKYSLSFNLIHSQAVTLDQFFANHGGVKAFQFRDKERGLVKVVCPKWGTTKGKTHTKFSCEFEEVI